MPAQGHSTAVGEGERVGKYRGKRVKLVHDHSKHVADAAQPLQHVAEADQPARQAHCQPDAAETSATEADRTDCRTGPA
eukprot:2523097-Rhodomonas_salina.1